MWIRPVGGAEDDADIPSARNGCGRKVMGGLEALQCEGKPQ
jgi:hypothetical protein